MLRQPIVTVMGHVDHGKTSLLDAIRGTSVAAKEAGGITQAIGASVIPAKTIAKSAGALLAALKLDLKIPGLLFIDTPGHAAFVNLRKRGGNLADIAVLVIDVTKGIEQQTVECLQILRTYKTPFVVAANKVDALEGWRSGEGAWLQLFASQQEHVQRLVETKLYEIVGQLFEHGFEAERFDRVGDFTKRVAIVPTSAKTREGIPELLVMLAGLAQRFLERKLDVVRDGPGKGTILEIKEEKGTGMVADAVIYDGRLAVGDSIVAGGVEPVASKVKALFVLDGRKLVPVKSVGAAASVRIVAPGLENAMAGAPIVVGDSDELKLEVAAEVESVVELSDGPGVFIKADTLGSLEALSFLLKERNVPVRKAGIGPVSKKDIADAESMHERDPLRAVILGFNIPRAPVPSEKIRVFTSDIIYKLLDDYDAWVAGQRKSVEAAELDALVKPCKVEILKGYIFRQSNPAVVGVEVHAGVLRPNTPLMLRAGEQVTVCRGIQHEQEAITEAKKGMRVAASFSDVTLGRQLKEGDFLFTFMPESVFRKYKELKESLSPDVKDALREIAEIMREKNPVWGI